MFADGSDIRTRANVKHFAANNQETNRQGINEIIPERALRELYLPGFEACVKAGCATVMAAYNQINGVPCTENKWLLTDLLRCEWGFDGLVMSDWYAVNHPAAAVNAGCDVNMPGLFHRNRSERLLLTVHLILTGWQNLQNGLSRLRGNTYSRRQVILTRT